MLACFGKYAKTYLIHNLMYDNLSVAIIIMNLLQTKLAKFDIPQKMKAQGVYPYFRAIESDQDTEVIISGKKSLDVWVE